MANRPLPQVVPERPLTAAARRMMPARKRRTLQDLSASEIAGLEALFGEGYPESMLELARVLFVELLNMEVPQAAEVAFAQAEAMRAELGGLKIYLTRGKQFDADRRRQQILAEFTGDNTNALARKFGLSHERVRYIVRAQGL